MADRANTTGLHRTVEVPVWLLATAGGAVGAMLVLLWSLKRHSPLLELPDQHGVIRAQLPTAFLLLLANTLLMYAFVFRFSPTAG